ncbi:MAG: hypothetical protein IK090_04175 [Clostridia bacterium]|nr:hypothetical protein [Clostridia bacterium]
MKDAVAFRNMDLSEKKIAPLSPSLKDAIAFNTTHYTPRSAVCQSLFAKFLKKSEKSFFEPPLALDKIPFVCYNAEKMSKGVHFCARVSLRKNGAFSLFRKGTGIWKEKARSGSRRAAPSRRSSRGKASA